jgi:hypothetical protein
VNSKAVSLFEIDQRFHAIERGREREELFEDYVLNLERKVWDILITLTCLCVGVSIAYKVLIYLVCKSLVHGCRY